MRPVFEWQIGSRALQLGKRTLIMGVVNVTPDSFSDGGVTFDSERAVEHALKLLQDGADIIDVGGESTRPGAKVSGAEAGVAVTEKEELARVIPVIAGVTVMRALGTTAPEASTTCPTICPGEGWVTGSLLLETLLLSANSDASADWSRSLVSKRAPSVSVVGLAPPMATASLAP